MHHNNSRLIAANWFGTSGMLASIIIIAYLAYGLLVPLVLLTLLTLTFIKVRKQIQNNILIIECILKSSSYFFILILSLVALSLITYFFDKSDPQGIILFSVIPVLIGACIGYFYGFKILSISEKSRSMWSIIKIGFWGGTWAFFIIMIIASISSIFSKYSYSLHAYTFSIYNLVSYTFAFIITSVLAYIFLGWICSLIGIISALTLHNIFKSRPSF